MAERAAGRGRPGVRDEDDLRAFIGTSLHVAIMKRNRGHGTLVATNWTEPTSVSRRTAWQRAAARLVWI